MIRRYARAISCSSMLLGICLLAARTQAQAPLATSEPATQSISSQPVVPPQTYRINPNNLLFYQVHINSRSSQNPNMVEKIDRRELAVFDVSSDGNVVLYVGSPKDNKPVGAMLTPPQAAPKPVPGKPVPRSSPQTTPASPEAKADKPKNIELTWTKYEIGKARSQNSDGSVFVQPDSSSAAYPVLPLPPAEAKEKDDFEVTLPDVAMGTGKTVQLAATWKAVSGDKITVDARLKFKMTPGMTPEVASYGYEVARTDPAAVTRISGSRKLPGEISTPAAGEGVHPTTPHEVHRTPGKPVPGAKPTPDVRSQGANPAFIGITIVLEKTKLLSDDEHTTLISLAQQASSTDTEKAAGQKEGEKPSDAQGLIDQLQNGDQGVREQLKIPGQ